MNIDALRNALIQSYGFRFGEDWQPLTGGYESDVWRCGQWVVRIGIVSRDGDALVWTHKWVTHCASHLPQAIAPLRQLNGETVMRWAGRPVTVYPYITGNILNNEGDDQIIQAAGLLAKIHTLGLQWPGRDQYPQPGISQAMSVTDPTSIQDPALDQWEADFEKCTDLATGAVHGDYYRGNILVHKGQIAGIIDWDESDVRPIITELAWATWEFTHTASGDDVEMHRAREFVRAYQAEADILNNDQRQIVIPLIRRHLRVEIRRSIAAEARGEAVDLAYRNAEICGFNNLRGRIV